MGVDRFDGGASLSVESGAGGGAELVGVRSWWSIRCRALACSGGSPLAGLALLALLAGLALLAVSRRVPRAMNRSGPAAVRLSLLA